MPYLIQHRQCNGSTVEYLRKRKDAAEYLLRRLVRSELIAGYAGLDTQWGWSLARRAGVVASDILRGVPIGWTETVASGNPTHCGEQITIKRVAA